MAIIYDVEMIRKFYNILPRLTDDNVYFLSMASRNKYLSQEERETVGLGRTEMFARTVCRHDIFDDFLKKIRIMEAESTIKTSRNGMSLPLKSLVCYVNIHSSSSCKALMEFNKKLHEMMFNNSLHSEDGHKWMAKSHVHLLNCYQRAKGTKKFIDIDFDVGDHSYIEEFVRKVNRPDIRMWQISTKGGWHILMEKENVNFNFPSILRNLDKEVKKHDATSEIVVNKNAMVPCPGTIQGGYEVKIEEIKESE